MHLTVGGHTAVENGTMKVGKAFCTVDMQQYIEHIGHYAEVPHTAACPCFLPSFFRMIKSKEWAEERSARPNIPILLNYLTQPCDISDA